MNLANCVRFWARWDPDGVHIRFDGRDTTWSELDERTSRLANGLAARGVGHGDRVAILSNNTPAYLELVPAVHKLGAILVPLNVRLATAELRYLVDHSGSKVVVVEPALRPQLDEAVAGLDPGRQQAVEVIELGAPFDALFDADATDPATPVAADDVAFLCYTSGTTGLPKGAMLATATCGRWPSCGSSPSTSARTTGCTSRCRWPSPAGSSPCTSRRTCRERRSCSTGPWTRAEPWG